MTLVVAGVYFGAAELGLSLAYIHANVSPVWPPTGVAIAAVLLLGRRALPGILVGAFAANFFTPIPIGSALGIAIGNTLEAATVGWLLGRVDFQVTLTRSRDVTWFLAASVLATIVAATIGNVSLCLGGAAPWQNFTSLWLTWWLGDLAGGLSLAPLFLIWGSDHSQPVQRDRWLEAALLFSLFFVTAMVVFGGWFPTAVKTYPLAHLTFPLLIWAAFRFGHHGTTLVVLLLSAVAVWGTQHGFGPFARGTPNESLLLVQLFIGVCSLTMMFLAAVIEERRAAGITLKESEHRVGANLAVTQILAESPALVDATPRIVETICRTLGWELGALWIPDSNGVELRCLHFWRREGISAADRFEQVTRERTFLKGVGLPGRVWASGTPAWILDVENDKNFPRAEFAVTAKLHAAFAFPILFGNKFLGVMEFFSREIRKPDEAMLAMFESIGGQIGQFMERKRNEDEREHLLVRELLARAEAEQANRTKDEFLAIVSHELRTPLNAIVGWASMLRTGSLEPAKATRAIEVIDRNAKAQAQLIEDILDVSRVVSGNLRLDPRPVHLPRVIEAAVDSIRPTADAKQIKVNVELDNEAGPVSGDPDRLEQIVWNLLSNAVKFTPASGEVNVRLTGSNAHVEVEVTDNGQGIPAEFLPHVFDRFRQVDGSKTRRHGGLGLGLTIVRSLVQLHGGDVKAHSDGEGKGTTFRISLPCLGVSNLSTTDQRLDRISVASSTSMELSGVPIFLVEDDRDSRDMLETVLKSQGASVVSASSVNEALQELARSGWTSRVLVSDLGMPDRDGYDLIAEVRAHVTAEQIPAVAITGYAGGEEGARAIAAGFQKHLTKPVNWRELIDALTEFGKQLR